MNQLPRMDDESFFVKTRFEKRRNTFFIGLRAHQGMICPDASLFGYLA